MHAARRTLFATVISLGALSAVPTTVHAQAAGEHREVRAAMAEFMDALNALDIDRIDRGFAETVTAFVPTAQDSLVVGRPALTAIFRAFADRVRPTTPRLSLVPQDLRVLRRGELAVVTFQIIERVPLPTRRRTFVFQRTRGQWLIVHMHASDVVPPAP
jgi:ketosteroid isomerase-like protein